MPDPSRYHKVVGGRGKGGWSSEGGRQREELDWGGRDSATVRTLAFIQ